MIPVLQARTVSRYRHGHRVFHQRQEWNRLLQKSEDPLFPRSSREQVPRKSIIPPLPRGQAPRSLCPRKRVAGIQRLLIQVDSRFLPASAGMTGNDGLKTAVGACGLSSPAVNLSHTLFRPENPVFCAVNARMGQHFLQLLRQARPGEGAGQPHIKSLSHQYLISEAIVQCRPDTLLPDADLRRLTLQKIDRHMPNHSHIVRCITPTNPTLVFPKRHIQSPVQLILDSPV